MNSRLFTYVTQARKFNLKTMILNIYTQKHSFKVLQRREKLLRFETKSCLEK
jgi:hypothetical protein